MVVHRKPTGLEYPLAESLGLPFLLPLGTDVRCRPTACLCACWLAVGRGRPGSGRAPSGLGCCMGAPAAPPSQRPTASCPVTPLAPAALQVANGGKAAEKTVMERVMQSLAPLRRAAAAAEGAPALPPPPTAKKARGVAAGAGVPALAAAAWRCLLPALLCLKRPLELLRSGRALPASLHTLPD